jgi:hemerythrin-like metal-binding protein
MTLLNWTSALETGQTQIDSEHRVLVDLLNRIHALYLDGDPADVLEVLHELERYTEYHFAHEEALMAEYDYEFTDIHKAEHRQFCADVRDYIRDFVNGRVAVPAISLFMQRWLLRHIAGSDRLLGEAIARVVAIRSGV